MGWGYDISSYFKSLREVSLETFQFVYVRLYYSPATDYCLPLSRMARMEMDYNLKKLANFFKFSL